MGVHLLYGNHPFHLETRALVRIRALETVEKVAVSDSLSDSSYLFPVLKKYCNQHRIRFDRDVQPDEFSVERYGVYLARDSDITPEIAANFRERGLDVVLERVI